MVGCADEAAVDGDLGDELIDEEDSVVVEGEDSDIVIGFSLGTMLQERWQREAEMAQDFADEHGFTLIVQSCEEDAARQISQVENMVALGVDVIIIAAQDSESAGVVVDVAHEAGIPVLSYERLVRNGDIDYHIGFDAVDVGRQQAKSLVEKYPEGNYIWLFGGQEDALANLYIEGQTEVMQPLVDSGAINIVLQQWTGWQPDEALRHTENGLTMADNDVQAVLASNDGTAGGAVQALIAQGLGGQVGVSGQDADIAACQRIAEGTQTMTVYKPLINLNTIAMELAYALAKGDTEKIESLTTGTIPNGRIGTVDNGYKEATTLWMDVIPVTKDNIVDTIIKDGFHALEDVYSNVPEDQWPDVN